MTLPCSASPENRSTGNEAQRRGRTAPHDAAGAVPGHLPLGDHPLLRNAYIGAASEANAVTWQESRWCAGFSVGASTPNLCRVVAPLWWHPAAKRYRSQQSPVPCQNSSHGL